MIFDNYVLHKVCQFSRTKEHFIISTANRNLHKVLFPLFLKRITNLLKSFYEKKLEIDWNFLIKTAVEEKQLIISGSSILQAILQEDWNSDIDFYVHDKTDSRDFVENIGIPHGLVTTSKLVHSSDWYNKTIKGLEQLTYQKKYSTQKTLNYFELIGVKIDPIEYIKNRFDFDVLRNYIYVKDGCVHFHIHSLHQILNRITNYRTSATLDKSVERYKRYKDRGFCFYQSPEWILAEMMTKTDTYQIPHEVKKIGSGCFQFEKKYKNQSKSCEIFRIKFEKIYMKYLTRTSYTFFYHNYSLLHLSKYFVGPSRHLKVSEKNIYIDDLYRACEFELCPHNAIPLKKYKKHYHVMLDANILKDTKPLNGYAQICDFAEMILFVKG
jgi:hypothetical protein